MKEVIHNVLLGAMVLCASYAALCAILGDGSVQTYGTGVFGGVVAAIIFFLASLPFNPYQGWR